MLVHIDRNNNATQVNGRIPTTLQNVFLTSNRGLEVNAPPPLRVGDKVFRRSLLGRTYSSESSDSIRGRREKASVKQPSFALRFWNKDGTQQRSGIQEATKREGIRTVAALKRKSLSTNVPSLSPQQYLNAMIGARGYNVQAYATLSSAYYNQPTPLQLASYGTYIVGLVKTGNDLELEQALASGLSRNPCNAYGESLLHSICRRGDNDLFQVMLKAGSDVQTSDDCGRTPLHYACWAAQPAFDVVEKLLELDAGLLYMADSRGSLPLAYTRKEHWSAWLQFLESKKNTFWSRETANGAPPPLALLKPNSRPVQSPPAALSLELAGMVANGRMSSEEARFLTVTAGDESGSSSDDLNDSFSDDDSTVSEYSSCEQSIDSNGSPDVAGPAKQDDDIWNEDEMNDILNSLLSAERRPLKW